MCAQALYFCICSQAHSTYIFYLFFINGKDYAWSPNNAWTLWFPQHESCIPSPLGFWSWWEILLLFRDSVYCALFGFPFLACRLIAFDCFNCAHSYKTLVGLHSLNHTWCRGRRHVYGVWVFECAYYLVRGLWQWWLNTSCSPVQGFC